MSGKMLRFHRSTGLVVNAALSRADRCERRPHTNSWVAGVVNALPALALGVQAAPLVSALLRFGAAAACRTEAVAAVPGQHRTGLSQNSCRTDREEKDYYDDFRKHVKCRRHQTSSFSQEQKRCLWEKKKKCSYRLLPR